LRKLLYLMLTIAAVPALGHPPPGANPNSEIYKWFDRQKNVNNQGCCGEGDGHILEADEVRTDKNTGEMDILIEGHWIRVARK
jgi:hypothetical protein